MEGKTNLTKSGTKPRWGGCPTRLQKHAPASLEINKVFNPLAFSSAEASKAIPLLSPLILSQQRVIPLLSPLIIPPQPLYAETTMQARTPGNSGNGSISNNEGKSSSSSLPTTGWQHPAMASFPEPSSLCSFLRKQCVIANHAQCN